jgi:cytoskeletal protein RodZ
MYEGDDLNYEDEETPPEESSNRTFLIAAGILGGIVLLSLACVVGYWLVILPRQKAAQQTSEQSAQATQNAQINEALTATGVAFDLSQTPQASATALPTNTLVVAQPTATNTPLFTNTPDPATETVAAALTRVAAFTATVILTSTALPTSGFADQFGFPGLFITAIVLIAVIFLARRLRSSPTQ